MHLSFSWLSYLYYPVIHKHKKQDSKTDHAIFHNKELYVAVEAQNDVLLLVQQRLFERMGQKQTSADNADRVKSECAYKVFWQ